VAKKIIRHQGACRGHTTPNPLRLLMYEMKSPRATDDQTQSMMLSAPPALTEHTPFSAVGSGNLLVLPLHRRLHVLCIRGIHMSSAYCQLPMVSGSLDSSPGRPSNPVHPLFQLPLSLSTVPHSVWTPSFKPFCEPSLTYYGESTWR